MRAAIFTLWMPSAHRQGGYVPNAARLVVPLNIEKMFERPDVDQLVEAFQLVEGPDEIRAFLTDLCTPREICDFAQRLQVARYLDEGEPYVEVQARTGASSTTVSRVSKSLNGEYGGFPAWHHTQNRCSNQYPSIQDRLSRQTTTLETILEDIRSDARPNPLSGRHHSHLYK